MKSINALREQPDVMSVRDLPSENGSGNIEFSSRYDRNAVTGTTFFGREPKMHEALIDYFVQKKSLPVPDGGYHIFFPASSVGCEPYYFAMLARDKNILDGGFLTIHASDLQEQFVKYAKNGVYPKATTNRLDNWHQAHFNKASNPFLYGERVQLSDDILESVVFERSGDIRNHRTHRLYDAVVLTHVIYHSQINMQMKKELLEAAAALSRDLVVTDYCSFSENKAMYETVLRERSFGVADDNLDYKPLKVVRERSALEVLADKTIPARRPMPVTDITHCEKACAFVAVRAPGEPS